MACAIEEVTIGQSNTEKVESPDDETKRAKRFEEETGNEKGGDEKYDEAARREEAKGRSAEEIGREKESQEDG